MEKTIVPLTIGQGKAQRQGRVAVVVLTFGMMVHASAARATEASNHQFVDDAKLVIVQTIAGQYTQQCHDLIPKQLNKLADQKILIDRNGQLNSSIATLNLISQQATVFALTINPAQAQLNALIDLRNKGHGKQGALLSITQSGQQAFAHLTTQTKGEEHSLGCSGLSSNNLKVNLWSIVHPRLKFTSVTAHCVRLPTGNREQIQVSLSDGVLHIGEQQFDQTTNKTDESMFVKRAAVTYGFTSNDGHSYELELSEQQFSALLIRDREQNTTVCQ